MDNILFNFDRLLDQRQVFELRRLFCQFLLCDGHGTQRVIDWLEHTLFEVSPRDITIADSSDVLHWRNDPASRQMSLTGNIVLPPGHSRWFGSMLQSNLHIGIIGEKIAQKLA